jgi:hypothetical protein
LKVFYFDVLKSSIFFLSFWGLQFFVLASQGRKRGICLSSCDLGGFFCYSILSFKVFNFILVILWTFFFFFCANFIRGRGGIYVSSCELWKFCVIPKIPFYPSFYENVLFTCYLQFWGSTLFQILVIYALNWWAET